MSPPSPPPGYRIGAAAALSGLPVNTIRNWEKRYQVVSPARTGAGDRRYSDQDIEKLVLLRQLTERGLSIRDIAGFSNDQLTARLGKTRQGETRALVVGCMDESMCARLSRDNRTNWSVQGPLAPHQLDGFAGDVLVLELEMLGGAPLKRIERLRATTPATLFVVYEFTTQGCLARLGELGVWLYRRPVYEVVSLARVIELSQPQMTRKSA